MLDLDYLCYSIFNVHYNEIKQFLIDYFHFNMYFIMSMNVNNSFVSI